MPYWYLKDIAISDAASAAWGTTLEELFVAAADATMNVMVEPLSSIVDLQRRPIDVADSDLDMLLFVMLQELIFLKDAEQLLLRLRTVRIEKRKDTYRLTAEAYGEKLNPEKHELPVDVKAVTMHRFRLEQTDRRWEATVVLDI
ncbi:MAG: archease [Desulfobulbaceae bacterium]|nr:archease [Desulfobulbaceae bacterium]